MKFVSTRARKGDLSAIVSPSEAILSGLAPDGGLYVPKEWPQIQIDEFKTIQNYPEFASKLLKKFFNDDILEGRIEEICRKAFNFPLPLKELKNQTALLELFHGPTNAFKDFGARFLALTTESLLDSNKNAKQKRKPLVLVATSGDTGGAVASAFCQCTRIPVAILYPKNKISKRQELQLTTWGDQVQAFSVQGDFDDCQRIVKQAFSDQEWQSHFQLTSANSINIARLLPQMTYFAFSSVQYFLKHNLKPGFIVPSGNVGNATAALWALKLGFPIREVILAHNANRAVPDYFSTQKWQPKATIATLANAMDVGNPSNFERIQNLYANFSELSRVAKAFSVSDEQIKKTIQEGKDKWGEIWCPHTATAVCVREQMTSPDWIVVATAHPAKFETIIEPLINEKIPVPRGLNDQLKKNSHAIEISANIKSLSEKLKN